MGFLQRLSTIVPARPMRADSTTAGNYNSAFFSGDPIPDVWSSTLSAAGITVTPDLAMTLSAMYCGVTTIAYDLATLPLQVFQYRDDGGKDRVKPGLPGQSVRAGSIGDLAYRLRWGPNAYQTTTEFILSMVVQWLLRSRAYAEIVDGPSGFLEQLIPRHPDRVWPERLPNGRLRYKLIEVNGSPRYLTQEEMFVVRDMSMDGVTSVSRITYGAGAFGAALAAERAASKFFKSGMTAAVVVTYKGDGGMEEEEEKALHGAITRYASGVENTFGALLVPDDITVSNLGVEPEKAQMMLAREWGAREVARSLRMPPHKLMIAGAQSYASQVQAAIDYVVGCLRPIAVTFEQAIQRDLILAKDVYFAEFELAALLRGDPAQQADFLSKMIQVRVMRPSEARLTLNMNPDAELDRLSATDHKPGQSPTPPAPTGRTQLSGRATTKALLCLHDNAVRVLHRERVAVEKLAQKYPSDVAKWQAGLRQFYGDHATFICETMRLSPAIARGYAAQHGSEIEAKGVVVLTDEWERAEADELFELAAA
jgi:HK97 family phage portal protein